MIVDISVLPRLMPWLSKYTTSRGAEDACKAERVPFTGFAMARTVLGLKGDQLRPTLADECVPVSVRAGLQERGTILVNAAGRVGICIGYNRVAAPCGRAYAVTSSDESWWVEAWRPKTLVVTLAYDPDRTPFTSTIPVTQGGSVWGGFGFGGAVGAPSHAAGAFTFTGSTLGTAGQDGIASGTVVWAGAAAAVASLRGSAAGAMAWIGNIVGDTPTGDYNDSYSDTYGTVGNLLSLGVLQAGFLSGGYGGSRTTADYAGGCRVAMYEAFWDRIENPQGTFIDAQIATVVSNINDLVNKGFKVSLGLGLHWPRAWVDAAAGGTAARFKNQAGTVDTALDYVWTQSVRDLAAIYITRLLKAIGPEKLWAIRLTSGSFSELLYPTGSGYWAYNDAAQLGTGLARGQKVCPSPGWVAGTTHPDGLAGVQEWRRWYIQSLANTALWMKGVCDDAGFRNNYEVICPGSGRRTFEVVADEAANLPVGSVLRRGAAWREIIQSFPPSDRMTFIQSGTGDTTGGSSNYIPLESDSSVNLDSSAVSGWSSYRWMKAAAQESGFDIGGENPGWGDTNDYYYRGVVDPDTGTDYTGSASMLSKIFAMITATSKPAKAFYFAHGANLYNGTLPASEYYNRVTAVGGSAPLDPPPLAPGIMYFDAEGEGDPGTAVTLASSGATVTVTGAATVTYATTPAGGTAYRFNVPATVDTAQMSIALPSSLDVAADFEFVAPAHPVGQDARLWTLRHASGTSLFILYQALAKIRVQNSATTVIGTSALSLVPGRRYKLSIVAHVGTATTGSVEVAIYDAGDRATPLEVIVPGSTLTNLGTAPLTAATVGKSNPTAATAAWQVDIDNIRIVPDRTTRIPV